jgi:hypothetical protein
MLTHVIVHLIKMSLFHSLNVCIYPSGTLFCLFSFLGFDSRRGLGIFLFITASRTAMGPTQPPTQWVPGAPSLGLSGQVVKLTTHIHPMPRSRMRGAIPPLPQYAFMAWCSVKHRENFTFYLYLLGMQRH